MTGLDGIVAVVTGGAQGIGECIVAALARDGAAVFIGDLQEEKAQAVAGRLRNEGLTVHATGVDVRSPASAGSLAQVALNRFGRVDLLINVASTDAQLDEPWTMSQKRWEAVIGTELSGAWWCTQALLPHMMERNTGCVVFVSPGSARIGGRETSVAHSAARGGLLGLTIGLALQLEPHGIRVNAIAPEPPGAGEPVTAEDQAVYEREFPLGVVGAQAIADACLYLARPSGGHVSGAVLNATGDSWRGL
jgi:3-oxoacyl-[acyl-carrier protein] reductase